jgi:hypothetical protein
MIWITEANGQGTENSAFPAVKHATCRGAEFV